MYEEHIPKDKFGPEAERKFKERLHPVLGKHEDIDDIRVARDHADRAASEFDRLLRRLPELFNKFGCDVEVPDMNRGWRMVRVVVGLDDIYTSLKELQWLLQEEYNEKVKKEKPRKKQGKKFRHGNNSMQRSHNRNQNRRQYERHCGFRAPTGPRYVPPKKFRGLLKASFAEEETT